MDVLAWSKLPDSATPFGTLYNHGDNGFQYKKNQKDKEMELQHKDLLRISQNIFICLQMLFPEAE